MPLFFSGASLLDRQWIILQLCDSSFPAGGFAHSNGLEAAWLQDRLADTEALKKWIGWQLHQTSNLSAPFANAAYAEPDRFLQWDVVCDAMLSNQVANRASRAQGAAFLLATSRSFEDPRLLALAGAVRRENSPAHFAPAFGAACCFLGIGQESMIRMLLFLALRGSISAAVRLGATGPIEGQRIQAAMAERAESLVQPAMACRIDDAAQTAPMLDLVAATHDRLYSRLFQS